MEVEPEDPPSQAGGATSTKPPSSGLFCKWPPAPTISYHWGRIGEWHLFCDSFIEIATLHKYNQEQAKSALLFCMKGAALRRVINISLDKDKVSTVDELLMLYEKRLFPLSHLK